MCGSKGFPRFFVWDCKCMFHAAENLNTWIIWMSSLVTTQRQGRSLSNQLNKSYVISFTHFQCWTQLELFLSTTLMGDNSTWFDKIPKNNTSHGDVRNCWCSIMNCKLIHIHKIYTTCTLMQNKQNIKYIKWACLSML